MGDIELKARDKKVVKMTRNGLVEKNLTDGTEQRISDRKLEVSLTEEADKKTIADHRILAKGISSAREASNTRKKKRRTKNSQFSQKTIETPEMRSDTAVATEASVIAVSGRTKRNRKRRKANAKKKQQQNNIQNQVGEQIKQEQDFNEDISSQHNTDSLYEKSTGEQESQNEQEKQRSSTRTNKKTDTSNETPEEWNNAKLQHHKVQKTSRLPPNKLHNNVQKRSVLQGRSTALNTDKKSQLKNADDKASTAVKRKRIGYKDSVYRTTAEISSNDKYDNPEYMENSRRFTSNNKESGNVHQSVKQESNVITSDTKTSPQENKHISKLQHNAEKYDAKLSKAQSKLPTRRVIHVKREFDELTGRATTRLSIEKEVKTKSKPNILVRPVKFVARKSVKKVSDKVHNEISKYEEDNVGVKAAHKTQKTVTGSARNIRRTKLKFKKGKIKKVSKLQKKTTKINAKLQYKNLVQENPLLRTSNPISKAFQKRAIKRQHAQAFRNAKKAGSTIQKTANMTVKAARAVTSFVITNIGTIAPIVAVIAGVLVLFSLLSSCSVIASSVVTGIFSSSYLSEDEDINNSENLYSTLERDLLKQARNAETDRPGYDEYRYQFDDISHNPFELMAYLTAMYIDFKFIDVEAYIREVFDEQYILTYTEEIETRYRTITLYDPDTGEEYEIEEPYEWRILNVKVQARSFTDVVYNRMSPEQIELFEMYMKTKGNRQYLTSPLDFNWLPFVETYIAYNDTPTAGIEISVDAGIDVHAGQNGTVTFAGYDSEYGYIVVIEDNKGLISKYGYCGSTSVSEGQTVKSGDVIATTGSDGLYMEIIKDGKYLNPVYFAETNDDGSSLIPPGMPGGLLIPDYPGSPMGDGSYTALIEEAERFIGFPYVWGGSSPTTSFDCSGYVSWVLNQSGVKTMSRTTAQGLFNKTTPVSASNAQPGDLIFFTGTYSSMNPVTHVGIYVGGGMMLHCGNPIQYTSINTNYWQSHFYAYGRIN